MRVPISFFFFFNDTATTEIYTLSLHDALPIWAAHRPSGDSAHHCRGSCACAPDRRAPSLEFLRRSDRKSTRLNSSHANISYAVFCLEKKKSELLVDGSGFAELSVFEVD